MRCPVCNFRSTRVVDSRISGDGLSVRRRRECERAKCSFRFSTIEEVELLDITVVKRNGRREAYAREKLLFGVRRSLIKLPYTEAQVQGLLHTMERDIQKTRANEVTSAMIGDIVMHRLREFNKVAYIRFASVYRAFDDVATFAEEVRKLEAPKKGRTKKDK